jgi:hypothetical protein
MLSLRRRRIGSTSSKHGKTGPRSGVANSETVLAVFSRYRRVDGQVDVFDAQAWILILTYGPSHEPSPVFPLIILP